MKTINTSLYIILISLIVLFTIFLVYLIFFNITTQSIDDNCEEAKYDTYYNVTCRAYIDDRLCYHGSGQWNGNIKDPFFFCTIGNFYE